MKIEKFINLLIKKATIAKRYSTANAYLNTLRNYQQFIQKPSQTFEELTPEGMKNYEMFMLRNGLRYNTISLYNRMMRSICNQAVARKVANINTAELFRDVFMGCKTTVKRTIKPAVIGQLIDADFSQSPQLEFSRDLFLLSFYLRGISFMDLAYLCKSNVQYNTLIYFRQKNGKMVCIRLEDCALKIIRQYAGQCKESTYLLPIISGTEREKQKQYRSSLRLYNKHLQQISKLLGLNITLTSCVPRHTWITTAQNTNIPIAVINTSMGKSSDNVTYSYLDPFENHVLNNANKQVIAAVMRESWKRKKSILLIK